MPGANVGQNAIFEYDSRWYEVAITITHPEIKGVSLDLQHIVSFEYVNSLNSMFLTGELLFVDTGGEIGRYLNRLYTHVQATITQKKKEKSGNDETFVDENRGKWTTFYHEFLVDNIQIIKRSKSEILYKLYLVSNQWYLFCSKFSFSNYDKADGADELKIFKIIQKALDAGQIKHDTASFDSASDKTLRYITNGNDTVISSIKYLLFMLYYSKSTSEDFLKFILYDPFDGDPGKGLIKCLDFENPETYLKNEKAQIMVSLFETSFETFFDSQENDFSMVIKKPATQMYQDFFTHKFWNLDLGKQDFENEEQTTQEFVTLANNIKEVKDAASGIDKYSELNTKWFANDLTSYYHNGAKWNSNYDTYRDMVDDLMARDSLIINTAGEQSHQPGAGLDIELDRTELKNAETGDDHREKVLKGHRQLESLWIITKARHIYRPAPPSYYRENLVLSRNYNIPPMPEVIPAADVTGKI